MNSKLFQLINQNLDENTRYVCLVPEDGVSLHFHCLIDSLVLQTRNLQR